MPGPFDEITDLFELWRIRTFGKVKSDHETKIHTPEVIEIPREEIKVEKYICKPGEHIYLGLDGQVSIVKNKYEGVR